MRNKTIAAACLAIVMAGCQAITTGACTEVLKIEANPSVSAFLNSLPPTSAGGILWADLKAGCAKGASPDWLALVLAELKALFPNLI
jgi:hypothetical protein